jgi:hypothetical protein
MKTTSPAYIALQLAWYERLKEEGFKDIEKFHPTKGNSLTALHSTSAYIAKKYNSAQYDYFDMVQDYSFIHNFTSDLEKQVWDLFASGNSLRDMVKIIPNSPSIWKLWHILEPIKKAMEKYYNRSF